LRKTIIPACLILVLASIICFFVAKEYMSQKHDQTISKMTAKTDEETETIEEDLAVVSADRMIARDRVILMKKDIKHKELTLRNIAGGKEKTLSYDGTTVISTKNDRPMTAEELQVGEILDVTFTTYNSVLSEISESKDIWTNKEMKNYLINEKAGTIQVGDNLYELDKNIVVASENEVVELMDITSLDTISIYGEENKIYSIIINDGHGYIRVVNDAYFVGGWIEIGQEIIKVLSDDMLIPIHEGTYEVKVSNKGYAGKETVTVKRDKETKLDLSKIEIEEVAVGHVLFDITPDFAQLYVDGLITNFEERVPLEYGIHSVRVEMAGYETVSCNIKVGSELANIEISLDRESDSSSSSSSSSSTSSSSSSSSETVSYSTAAASDTVISTDTVFSDNKKMYVEGPQGAEIYLDGTYIGVAPCNTLKVTGTHTITLAKSGYQTKSYTVNVSNDGKDLTLSFSDLLPQ